MSPGAEAAAAASTVAAALAGLRWLRVAQREHYLAGSSVRFARRWWTASPLAAVLGSVGAAGVALAFVWPVAGVATALVVGAGPPGLALRGRSSPLAWTRRLTTLAGVSAGLEGAGIAAAWAAAAASGAAPGVVAGVVAALALAVPLVVDLACLLTAPVERMASERFVRAAEARLARVAPTVVAVTGSYGKTTTKGYIAHLLSGRHAVLASPASYNNRSGLARTVNEHLAVGTDVLVAEMGTYGPGEIAELCSWLHPSVSAITAIGPVHLERFGSEDRILEAKAEIAEGAAVVVLNVDDPRLAGLARSLGDRSQRVVSASAADLTADVCALPGPSGLAVHAGGRLLACVAGVTAPPTNVAVAVAVALELGVDAADLGRLLPDLPVAPNRLRSSTSAAGFAVIDDTYNSNPAGCRLALEALGRSGTGGGSRVVVTPGMVELGGRQVEENAAFGAAAAGVADEVVVVGRTNRRALARGVRAAGSPSAASRRPATLVTVSTREDAVAWAASHLQAGDAILYENDLPDHYP